MSKEKMTDEKEFYWEPIEIKPGDQNLVGEVIKTQSIDQCEILYVGQQAIYARDMLTSNELTVAVWRDWLIRRERPKRKVWAFGWYRFDECWHLSTRLFPGQEYLYDAYPAASHYQWPAKMNADGTFSEPE